jgi:two-component system, NarL family, response regulator YdfI
MDPASSRAKREGRVTALVAAETELRVASLEAMLKTVPGLRVVTAPLAMLPALAERLEPRVVVIAASPLRVLPALEPLSGLRTKPVVVVLTAEPGDVWTTQARRAGVRAVLPTDATASDLAMAIAATTAGLILLHPDAVRGSREPRAASREASDATLTQRESEILEMMAEGLRNRAIAARLSISRYTVKFHVASILAKLGATSRTEAVTLGVRHGLIAL